MTSCTALFAMIAAMAGIVAYLAPAPATAEEHAASMRKHVESSLTTHLTDVGKALPPGTRFIETYCDCGHDTEDWALLQVSPAEFERIRKRVGRRDMNDDPGPHTRSVVKNDYEMLPYPESHRPAWWRPSALPDAEVVAYNNYGGVVFVFSQSTGKIFIMAWTV